MPSKPCTRTRLAGNSVAQIEACSCGAIIVHIGPLTMRLTPGSLQGLAQASQQAAAKLESSREDQSNVLLLAGTHARGEA